MYIIITFHYCIWCLYVFWAWFLTWISPVLNKCYDSWVFHERTCFSLTYWTDHHLSCEVCWKQSSLPSPPWFPFAPLACRPAKSCLWIWQISVSNLNWLGKADGWVGHHLWGHVLRLQAVKWNEVQEFHHNVGLCCHLVAEISIASVCHTSRDFNNLKDNAPPTHVYTDKTLKTWKKDFEETEKCLG